MKRRDLLWRIASRRSLSDLALSGYAKFFIRLAFKRLPAVLLAQAQRSTSYSRLVVIAMHSSLQRVRQVRVASGLRAHAELEHAFVGLAQCADSLGNEFDACEAQLQSGILLPPRLDPSGYVQYVLLSSVPRMALMDDL